MEIINLELQESNENRIINEFAKRLQISPLQLIEQNKNRRISDARQLYCKLRYDRHGLSYKELGHELDRAHTTVRYGVLRINNLLLNDKRILTMWNMVKDISELPGRGG